MSCLTPYVIGDLHGCYDELLRLEDSIRLHADAQGWRPLFVSVGDVFDRGPKVKECLGHFLAGEKNQSHRMVIGNHESEFLRLLETFQPALFGGGGALKFPAYLFSLREDYQAQRRQAHLFPLFESFCQAYLRSWLAQGGKETLASYGCDPAKPEDWQFPREDLEYLTSLAPLWYDEHVVVTHALALTGELAKVWSVFGPAKPTRAIDPACDSTLKESVSSLLWNRQPSQQRADAGRINISGHTPLERVHVSHQRGFIQLDTGCVYGKRLTAYCYKSDSFLYTPSQTAWSK